MHEHRNEQLNRVVIKGYKSIKKCDLELGNINVFIGANGAGKTNFISVFEMLQRVLNRELSYYTAKKGLSALLYKGKGVTDSISVDLHFETIQYLFELEWTEDDRLLFREESLIVSGKEVLGGSNHKESDALSTLQKIKSGTEIPQFLLEPRWRIYQFHDTSSSSRIKSENFLSNDVTFLGDARNLAAFLYRLKNYHPNSYADILYAVQIIAPFFEDFILNPNELNDELITLRWKEKGCSDDLYASQLSDGTLRFICLATLLLQPEKVKPNIIIIDEPELGLHPFAITILAELVKKAAFSRQVILSTQSVELLNQFEAEDVVVVDRDEEGTDFKRLDSAKLTDWLEDDYSLGELWNKNILGGRFIR